MKENYRDIFKKHFDNHEDDIDPQIVWDNIRPKKDRRLIWFSLSMFFMLGSIAFVLFFYHGESTINGAESAKVIIDEPQIEQTATSDVVASKEVVESKIIKENIRISKPGKLKSETSSGAEQIFTEVIEVESENGNGNRKRIGNENWNGNESGNGKRVVVGQAQWTLDDLPKDNELAQGSQDSIEGENMEEKESEDVIVNSLFDLELLTQLNVILPVEKRLMYQLKMGPIETKINKDTEKVDKYFERFSLAINGDYGILKSDKNAMDESLLQIRKNTLQDLEAVRMNALLSYHFGPRISISSGLQYSRLNELFTWEGEYDTIENGEYVESIIETSNETITTIIEGEHPVNKSRNMRIYNKTNSVSVPLILNLSQSIGEFGIIISGGIEANVLQWRDGYVLGESGAPITLQAQEKSEFGLSYVGNLGLEYPLVRNLSLSVNVGYVQMKQSELNYSTVYKVKSAGLGLKYYFE